jgi:hypothetical protein
MSGTSYQLRNCHGRSRRSDDKSFPGVSASVSSLVGERSANISSEADMSEAISQGSDFATISIYNVRLNVSSKSNLSFLHHVKATIRLTNGDKTEMVLSDADYSGGSLPIIADQDKLFTMLSKGPVTIKFTGTGNIPTEATTVTSTFCIGMSAHTSKSLSDLK